jgi:hypothetical protein
VGARCLFFVLGLATVPSSCLAAQRPPRSAEDTSPLVSPSARLLAIAKRCARIASCAHAHDPPELREPGACVDLWLASAGEASANLPPCLSSADSCAKVRTCLDRTVAAEGRAAPDPGSAFCRAHPGVTTTCDGTRLIVCGVDDPDESASVECATFGATCAVVQSGGLTTRACVDPARCPSELTKAWCDGPAAVISCHDGEIERTACQTGSSCEAHTDGDGEKIAMCEVPGHVGCASPGTGRCDGSRLVQCEAHGHFGHERSVECAAAGLTCSQVERTASCTLGQPLCASGHASCDADALTFCAAGQRLHVSCSDIGLTRCEADGRGPEATCR